MSTAPRYAIYFVPAAEHPLYQFGRAVLGYDCYDGETDAGSPFTGFDAADWQALVREPRGYGFHATLKAPFRLSPPHDEAALAAAFGAFAGAPQAVPTIAPHVGMLGDFVAVLQREPCAALDDLAARCVTDFDRFRAPLTPADRARRLAAALAPREIANLDRWGYPYIFDSFRFHMTLTGPLPPARRALVLALLQEAFAAQCGDAPLAIDRLALLRQDDAAARFRVIAQAPLGGPS